MSNHSTSHTPLLSKPPSSNYHSITQEDPTLDHHSIHHHDLLIEDHPQPNPYISPPTPLPKLQVSIICLMRLCEPIAFTVVFPMVAFMIADFDPSLTEKEIGFYSGAVESVFAMSQLLTIMIWGRLSDRIGRKPVLLLGISGAILSTILFGFSQSFHQMLLARGIGGILNGNSAVFKSMMAELTTSSNQALGFSFLPLSYAVGCTIGPLFGGYLSQPAQQFPNSWFSRTPFWTDFPWVLPCFVASIVPLVASVLSYVWLQETLPMGTRSLRRNTALIDPEDTNSQDLEPRIVLEDPMKPALPSILSLLKDQNLRIILGNYSLLSFQTIALEALIVLFAYTPIRSGGIGFSAASIGVAMSISGVFTMLVQLLLFTRLQNRFGTAKLYQICMSAYPIIFLLFPLIHTIATVEQSKGSISFIGVWISLGFMFLLKTSANIVFSCNMLLVNSAAPTRDSLGTINGIAQCCATFVRAIGPITASSLFAISIIHEKLLDGHMVFYLFAILALCGFLSSLNIRAGGEQWRNS